ncbi:MAG: double-strand break repair protein AddB [Hyphomonadaceae bacterium]|nr:double-strand break repair protein AddB [Hyphomonadaceae bacterium]
MSMLPLGLPEPLFSGPAPRLRVVPASSPFLDVLADAMVAELWRKDDPFALADALVLAPNRRSVRGLMDAFAKRLGGAALLPAIRPLGDPQADDDAELWAEDVTTDLPPPIPKLHRRLLLASLIRRRDKLENGVEDPARALALADELAQLLDSAASAERVAWEALPTLAQSIDLARHWASSAAFLDIIVKHWPAFLADVERSDPAAHGAQLRRDLAKRWSEAKPKRPIVVAGSTGSQASTRELMRVVAQLPRGVVVFPGLDVDLDAEAWALVGDQHPQFALKATLASLGVDREAVQPMVSESANGRARRVLVREALAPAEKTADWLTRLRAAGGAEMVAAGARGLRVLEAATEDEEATAIALMVREALERQDASVAVVTPDAALARRVEAKLARWNIAPSVSHGEPLAHTQAGRLLALLCELAGDASEPVALAGLLKHPRVALAQDADALAALERLALRGPRRFTSLSALGGLKELAESEPARSLVSATALALEPLTTLMSHVETTLSAFAQAIAEAAQNLAGDMAWAGHDGAAAAKLLQDVIEHGGALGAMSSYAAPRVMARLLERTEIPPPPRDGDPRVAIWGLFEARLQRRELMILAGLNEGVWPAPVGEDPFLSRAMRRELCLPALDERIGLAAHDFAQLASSPMVVLTRALRQDGTPTLASRWLWRLKTMLQGAGAELERADAYRSFARQLDAPLTVSPASRPQPRPPVHARIKKLSVTEVERLIRDPYAVYARRILGLDFLKPIGAPAGAAERGTAIHAAIERFGDGDDVNLLLRLLDEEMCAVGVSAERRAAEAERLKVSAAALVAWFADRRRHNPAIHREKRGVLKVGDVTLRGVADRIEIAPGYVAIMDYKTGDPPSDKQVESGLSPQLLLEAAMLARGAFEGAPPARVSELIYWRLGNADPTPRALQLETSAYECGEQALASLASLLARYAQLDQPFLSKPRVKFIKPYAEYDHLARRKEWADADGGEQ